MDGECIPHSTVSRTIILYEWKWHKLYSHGSYRLLKRFTSQKFRWRLSILERVLYKYRTRNHWTFTRWRVGKFFCWILCYGHPWQCEILSLNTGIYSLRGEDKEGFFWMLCYGHPWESQKLSLNIYSPGGEEREVVFLDPVTPDIQEKVKIIIEHLLTGTWDCQRGKGEVVWMSLGHHPVLRTSMTSQNY